MKIKHKVTIIDLIRAGFFIWFIITTSLLALDGAIWLGDRAKEVKTQLNEINPLTSDSNYTVYLSPNEDISIEWIQYPFENDPPNFQWVSDADSENTYVQGGGLVRDTDHYGLSDVYESSNATLNQLRVGTQYNLQVIDGTIEFQCWLYNGVNWTCVLNDTTPGVQPYIEYQIENCTYDMLNDMELNITCVGTVEEGNTALVETLIVKADVTFPIEYVIEYETVKVKKTKTKRRNVYIDPTIQDFLEAYGIYIGMILAGVIIIVYKKFAKEYGDKNGEK
jgi:hypothetical protein